MSKTVQGDLILVGIGEFSSTHFRLPILVVGLNRMLTGGTIWLLTHGHQLLVVSKAIAAFGASLEREMEEILLLVLWLLQYPAYLALRATSAWIDS